VFEFGEANTKKKIYLCSAIALIAVVARAGATALRASPLAQTEATIAIPGPERPCVEEFHLASLPGTGVAGTILAAIAGTDTCAGGAGAPIYSQGIVGTAAWDTTRKDGATEIIISSGIGGHSFITTISYPFPRYAVGHSGQCTSAGTLPQCQGYTSIWTSYDGHSMTNLVEFNDGGASPTMPYTRTK